MTQRQELEADFLNQILCMPVDVHGMPGPALLQTVKNIAPSRLLRLAKELRVDPQNEYQQSKLQDALVDAHCRIGELIAARRRESSLDVAQHIAQELAAVAQSYDDTSIRLAQFTSGDCFEGYHVTAVTRQNVQAQAFFEGKMEPIDLGKMRICFTVYWPCGEQPFSGTERRLRADHTTVYVEALTPRYPISLRQSENFVHPNVRPGRPRESRYREQNVCLGSGRTAVHSALANLRFTDAFDLVHNILQTYSTNPYLSACAWIAVPADCGHFVRPVTAPDQFLRCRCRSTVCSLCAQQICDLCRGQLCSRCCRYPDVYGSTAEQLRTRTTHVEMASQLYAEAGLHFQGFHRLCGSCYTLFTRYAPTEIDSILQSHVAEPLRRGEITTNIGMDAFYNELFAPLDLANANLSQQNEDDDEYPDEDDDYEDNYN